MPSNVKNPPIEPDSNPIVEDIVKPPADSIITPNGTPVHHTLPSSPRPSSAVADIPRITERLSRCPVFFSSKLGIAVMLGIFLIIVGSIWAFVPFPHNREIPRPAGIAVLLLGALLITTVTTPKLYFTEHPKPGHSFNYLRSAQGSVASGLDLPTSRVGTPVPPRSPSRNLPHGGPILIPNPGSDLRSRSPSPLPGTPTRTVVVTCTAREWIQHSDVPPSYNTLHCV